MELPFHSNHCHEEATQVDAPVAITVTPDGSSLVVGQMGEVSVPGDSLLTYYDKEGKLTKNLKSKLNDITGLAYSPKTGKLYATHFAGPKKSKATAACSNWSSKVMKSLRRRSSVLTDRRR